MKKIFGILTAIVLAFASAPAWAAVTLPDTGVYLTEYASAAITAMGAIVGACLLGYAAFLIVRVGVRWLGRAVGAGR